MLASGVAMLRETRGNSRTAPEDSSLFSLPVLV